MFCVPACLQKRTVKKSGDTKPKPKKDSDIVRERIIRRAALEFEDGMYGILFKKHKHHKECSELEQASLFWSSDKSSFNIWTCILSLYVALTFSLLY